MYILYTLENPVFAEKNLIRIIGVQYGISNLDVPEFRNCFSFYGSNKSLISNVFVFSTISTFSSCNYASRERCLRYISQPWFELKNDLAIRLECITTPYSEKRVLFYIFHKNSMYLPKEKKKKITFFVLNLLVLFRVDKCYMNNINSLKNLCSQSKTKFLSHKNITYFVFSYVLNTNESYFLLEKNRLMWFCI